LKQRSPRKLAVDQGVLSHNYIAVPFSKNGKVWKRFGQGIDIFETGTGQNLSLSGMAKV
jgi:hypothetical protein